MLHVQVERGVSGSSSTSLRYGLRFVECIFTRFGLSWVMPRRVLDLFACWWTSGRPRSAAIWKMVPTCILWCVWNEKNNRCFKDLERSLDDILTSFLHALYLWTVAFVSPLSLSFGDFLVRFSIFS